MFSDLFEAFDSADHTLFLEILNNAGVGPMTCPWFKNYSSDRQQVVLFGSGHSNLLLITEGLLHVPSSSQFIEIMYFHITMKQFYTVMQTLKKQKGCWCRRLAIGCVGLMLNLHSTPKSIIV